MTDSSNASPGAGNDLQVNGSSTMGEGYSQPGQLRIENATMTSTSLGSMAIKLPVGHYGILDGLVLRVVTELELQQPDRELGKIGVNVSMAATTGTNGEHLPALLYLLLADGPVYGQSVMTTVLDAELHPSADRLTQVVSRALDEIRMKHQSLVEDITGAPEK